MNTKNTNIDKANQRENRTNNGPGGCEASFFIPSSACICGSDKGNFILYTNSVYNFFMDIQSDLPYPEKDKEEITVSDNY